MSFVMEDKMPAFMTTNMFCTRCDHG